MMNAKPWLAPNAQAGSYALGMLGLEERKLLYQLARNIYTGEGAVVELGAFCGASTCCLAAGLRDNPRAAGHRVHSYDRFIANEPYLVDFIRTQFGESLEMGQSFAAIFRRATAEFADLVEVHAGDLLEQTWPSGVPIEILFVDVAKTLALSGKVLTEFFAHLIPGKSIVIHQDFYHPTAFYLPVVMDFLRDHFTIIEAGRDWSVVFRLETAIPQEKLRVASLYNFSFVQQQAALTAHDATSWHAGARLPSPVGMCGHRNHLRRIGGFERHWPPQFDQSRLEPDRVWSDGLAWCSDFKASRIRTRLYGAPSLMPSPTTVDKAYLMMSVICSAIAARIALRVNPPITG